MNLPYSQHRNNYEISTLTLNLITFYWVCLISGCALASFDCTVDLHLFNRNINVLYAIMGKQLMLVINGLS